MHRGRTATAHRLLVTDGDRRPAGTLFAAARLIATVAAPSRDAAGVLSLVFVFGTRPRRFRFFARFSGLSGRGLRFPTASGLGMLRFLHPAFRNSAVADFVPDTSRVAGFRLSERRNTSKCQQSQH